MNSYSFAHLSDAALLREFRTSLLQVREGTALLLAQIAEIDARRLFAPAGFSSMFLYCVRESHFSEDAAWRRIQAARAARRFPTLFAAIKDGRLHLTAICLIAPHLKPDNADELIHAASHLSRAEIQAWLARRFPQALPPPARERIRLVSPAPARVKPETTVLFAGHVDAEDSASCHSGTESKEETAARWNLPTEQTPPSESDEIAAGTSIAVARSSSVQAGRSADGGRSLETNSLNVTPAASLLAPPQAPRYLVQVTISGDTHEKLQHARALLSHVVGTDVAQVIDRALDALIERLESKKAGLRKKQSEAQRGAAIEAKPEAQIEAPAETVLPRQAQPEGASREAGTKRYIPRVVRRSVWTRDGGQCTFIGPDGQRCGEKWFLEFDHVVPVSQGGVSTVEGLRLRCRAHNQLEADRALGPEFMQRKRDNGKAKTAELTSTEEPGVAPSTVGPTPTSSPAPT